MTYLASRRSVLRSALALPALHHLVSHADSWPSQPIKWVVPYPPGGTTDMLARVIAVKLGERLGQPIVIENKPGAGGNIGTDHVAKQPANGYTMLMGNIGPISVNPSLYTNLSYNPVKDLAPVTLLLEVPNVLVINPALPVKSVQELIAYGARQNTPLSYATPGAGTSLHLAGELFAVKAKLPLNHVAYKGSAPGLNDTMAGHVPMMFDNLPSALQLVKSGKLRALAVTSSKRSPMLPNVPTMVEAGVPDYAITGWFGVMLRSGTPKPIIEKLHAELSAILAMPEIMEKLEEMGGIVSGAGPEAFARFIATETDKWSKLIKSSKISIG